jgi:hypothetical protein
MTSRSCHSGRSPAAKQQQQQQQQQQGNTLLCHNIPYQSGAGALQSTC